MYLYSTMQNKVLFYEIFNSFQVQMNWNFLFFKISDAQQTKGFTQERPHISFPVYRLRSDILGGRETVDMNNNVNR